MLVSKIVRRMSLSYGNSRAMAGTSRFTGDGHAQRSKELLASSYEHLSRCIGIADSKSAKCESKKASCERPNGGHGRNSIKRSKLR